VSRKRGAVCSKTGRAREALLVVATFTRYALVMEELRHFCVHLCSTESCPGCCYFAVDRGMNR